MNFGVRAAQDCCILQLQVGMLPVGFRDAGNVGFQGNGDDEEESND